MFKLWRAAEEDLLNGNGYRLRDTGQGLNRMQHASATSRLMHNVLAKTQQASNGWVGSSVIHLGDHNVPNALLFIDKYTQISRILAPIVSTIDGLSELAEDVEIAAYLENTFGGIDALRKLILSDFFK